jgi:hypothetical protein
MTDVNGNRHGDRIFWVEFGQGLRAFCDDPRKTDKILAEYIRSDVVADMVYDQHITYEAYNDCNPQKETPE